MPTVYLGPVTALIAGIVILIQTEALELYCGDLLDYYRNLGLDPPLAIIHAHLGSPRTIKS